MAHGDYNCCAICDCKLDYNRWDPRTKEEICPACLIRLRDLGLPIVTVQEFIEWVEKADIETLKARLKELGFRRCHFSNPVDKAVEARGIEFDDRRWVKDDP